jgi:hypothetical protein
MAAASHSHSLSPFPPSEDQPVIHGSANVFVPLSTAPSSLARIHSSYSTRVSSQTAERALSRSIPGPSSTSIGLGLFMPADDARDMRSFPPMDPDIWYATERDPQPATLYEYWAPVKSTLSGALGGSRDGYILGRCASYIMPERSPFVFPVPQPLPTAPTWSVPPHTSTSWAPSTPRLAQEAFPPSDAGFSSRLEYVVGSPSLSSSRHIFSEQSFSQPELPRSEPGFFELGHPHEPPSPSRLHHDPPPAPAVAQSPAHPTVMHPHLLSMPPSYLPGPLPTTYSRSSQPAASGSMPVPSPWPLRSALPPPPYLPVSGPHYHHPQLELFDIATGLPASAFPVSRFQQRAHYEPALEQPPAQFQPHLIPASSRVLSPHLSHSSQHGRNTNRHTSPEYLAPRILHIPPSRASSRMALAPPPPPALQSISALSPIPARVSLAPPRSSLSGAGPSTARPLLSSSPLPPIVHAAHTAKPRRRPRARVPPAAASSPTSYLTSPLAARSAPMLAPEPSTAVSPMPPLVTAPPLGGEPAGDYTCLACGARLPNVNALAAHYNEHKTRDTAKQSVDAARRARATPLLAAGAGLGPGPSAVVPVLEGLAREREARTRSKGRAREVLPSAGTPPRALRKRKASGAVPSGEEAEALGTLDVNSPRRKRIRRGSVADQVGHFVLLVSRPMLTTSQVMPRSPSPTPASASTQPAGPSASTSQRSPSSSTSGSSTSAAKRSRGPPKAERKRARRASFVVQSALADIGEKEDDRSPQPRPEASARGQSVVEGAQASGDRSKKVD